MKKFPIRILAANAVYLEGECESLVIPTVGGQLGILAGHSNMICAIKPGMLKAKVDGEEHIAAVSSGLMKVENSAVLILVDTIERPEEIDANRAKRAADEAKEQLLQKRSIREYKSAEANLARAIARLRVKNHNI